MKNAAPTALSALALTFSALALQGCGGQLDLPPPQKVHVTCFSSGQAVVDEIASLPYGQSLYDLRGPNDNKKLYPREMCTFEILSEKKLDR